MREIYNPQIYPELSPAKPARVWAAIVDDLDPAITYHHFLLNPQSIEWSKSAEYDEAKIPLTDVQPQLYKLTTGRKITLPDVLIDASWEGKAIESQLLSLEKLLQPLPKLRRPTAIALAWGATAIKPLVMTNLRVVEKAWAGGVCISATVSIELLQIPPNKNAPEAATEANFKAGLTARQKAEAQAVANTWVKTNKAKTPSKVQQKQRSGKLALSVANDGIVAATDDSGAFLGNVGRWDGKTLDTSIQQWVM